MASTSYNPLDLYQLIKKTTLVQTEKASIPVCHCVQSGTWFLLIPAGDYVQPAMV
jgi:hypothetical protein